MGLLSDRCRWRFYLHLILLMTFENWCLRFQPLWLYKVWSDTAPAAFPRSIVHIRYVLWTLLLQGRGWGHAWFIFKKFRDVAYRPSGYGMRTDLPIAVDCNWLCGENRPGTRVYLMYAVRVRRALRRGRPTVCSVLTPFVCVVLDARTVGLRWLAACSKNHSVDFA